MPHQSLGGASYFVSFIDDSTRNEWAYPIKTKDRVFSIFTDWLAKYKARLVVKGFRQEYCGDFDKKISPVVKMTTLCFMLGVVAADNLELIQLDVKTTFLHGDLQEEIVYWQD